MSRSKTYQQLLNDKRWWYIKATVWQRAGGLCERCKANGRITPGKDCHHIKPVEEARTYQEMESRCYDISNVQLLCIDCHAEAHHELRSKTKEGHIRTEQARAASWLDAHLAPADDDTSDGHDDPTL